MNEKNKKLFEKIFRALEENENNILEKNETDYIEDKFEENDVPF